MGRASWVGWAIVLAGCASGAGSNGASPGIASGGDTGSTDTWAGIDSSSSGGAPGSDSGSGGGDDESTGAHAGIDQNTTGGDDTDGSSSDGGGESSSDGGPPGDPGCPPGFALAFDVTDDVDDQLPASCAWFRDALLTESDRVSLEWWGTEGQHFGPVVWDLSGYDSLIADYGDCLGAVGNITSEDGQWWMTLDPGDSFVFLTAAGDSIQTGAAHIYGWLANEHVGNDEIMGIDFDSIAEAWSAKDTSGDRVVACYAL